MAEQVKIKKHKVYCKDCRFVRRLFEQQRTYCLHPNNLESWYEEPTSTKYTKSDPSVINANNDCGWYERERRSGKDGR